MDGRSCYAGGNIIAWVNTADGTLSGTREYGAFGESIASTGVGSLDQWTGIPFGFSTKYQDRLTGHYYYGYRFYDTNTGRWLSKDPIGELGGTNLYVFAMGDGINLIDVLGLKCSVDLYFGHGQLPQDGSDPLHKTQTHQAKEDLESIRKNNERHAKDVAEHRQKVKGMDPASIGYPRFPVNGNCGQYYGYAGCQPQYANSLIPAAQRAVNSRVFDDILDKNGDIPYTQENVSKAIKRLLSEGRNTAEKECGKKDTCCTSMSLRLKCDNTPTIFTGTDGVTGVSMGQLDRRCGSSRILDCKTKQWRGIQ